MLYWSSFDAYICRPCKPGCNETIGICALLHLNANGCKKIICNSCVSFVGCSIFTFDVLLYRLHLELFELNHWNNPNIVCKFTCKSLNIFWSLVWKPCMRLANLNITDIRVWTDSLIEKFERHLQNYLVFGLAFLNMNKQSCRTTRFLVLKTLQCST